MAAPLRIAMLGPAHPYRGGIAHFNDRLARGLRQRGHQVQVYTFTRQYPERLFPGRSQYAAEPEVVQSSPAAQRVLDSIGPLSWARTARTIREWKPDVLLTRHWIPFLAPSLGNVVRRLRRRHIPSIVIVDNALPHERRPGDIALSRYFLRASAALIVMSDSVRSDLERRIGVEAVIRTVAHPVYDDYGPPMSRAEARSTLGLGEDDQVVLFFGFVRRYKGLHVLLDAMESVTRRLPRAKLIVAGECYGSDAEYKAKLAMLPTGVARWDDDFIPDEQVPVYFSAADVVVQPYLSATQSGVAQIAHHFERPLIVTDVGGLPEFVATAKTGLVVRRNDVGALAEAIIRFFEESLAGRFERHLADAHEVFAWEPFFETIELLVEELKTTRRKRR